MCFIYKWPAGTQAVIDAAARNISKRTLYEHNNGNVQSVVAAYNASHI